MDTYCSSCSRRIRLYQFREKPKGKKLGIIGLAGSGKTTLAEFLANNSLPEETSQTLFAKDYEGKTLGDLGMKIGVTDSKSNHTKYDYAQEKELLLTSDIILYLFDISKLFSATEKDGYFKRINKEITTYYQILRSCQEEIDKKKIIPNSVSTISRALFKGLTYGLSEAAINVVSSDQSEPREKIFIALGTFTDKLNDLELTKNEFNSQFAAIQEKFKKPLDNFVCSCWCAYLNSLVDYEQAEETVKRIFEILKGFYDRDKDFIDKGYESVGNGIRAIGNFFK